MRWAKALVPAALAVGVAGTGAAQPPDDSPRPKAVQKKAPLGGSQPGGVQPGGPGGLLPGGVPPGGVPGGIPPGFVPQPGPPGTGPFGPVGPVGPGFPGFAGEQPSREVAAWVATLIDKMNDEHDAIRESARAGIVAVGPSALPSLRLISNGDSAKAYTARRLVEQIVRNQGGAGAMMGPPGGMGAPSPPARGAESRPAPQPGRPGAEPQPGRPNAEREPMAPNPLARVLGELKLTDDQTAQVDRAFAAYQKQARELLERVRSGQVDRADAPGAAEKIRADTTDALRRVLTPEQFRRLGELAPAYRSLFPTPDAPAERGRP